VTFCVADGLIAFQPLGPDYALLGVRAALWGGVGTGLVAALVGGTQGKATAPMLAGALLLAELLGELADDPRLPADPGARFVTAVALAAFVVGAAGLFQVAFGALRLGSSIKYLAYPVVAGLTGAVALLVLKSQLPIILGWNAWADWRTTPVSPAALLTGLVVLVVMVLGGRWLTVIPPQVIGIVVGTPLAIGLTWVGGPAIATVGALPASWPPTIHPQGALRFLGQHGAVFTIQHVLLPALSIAVFSSLNSLVASTAVDELSGEVHDGNRELVGQGLGNVAASLVGGLPGSGGASLSTMNYRCGGRTWVAGVAAALFLALFIVSVGDVLDLIPRAVLAAIVILGAVRLIDPWVLRLARASLSPERRADRGTVLINLGTMIGVATLGVVFNLIVAIMVGLLASSAHFIVRAARVRFRHAYRGDHVHSKRARPREDLEALRTLGGAIAVFELQGPLFFGSAGRIVARMQHEAPDARYVIVGLSRVDDIDASGFRVVYQFMSRLRREGRFVLIGHLTTRHPLWPHLADMGVDPGHVGDQFFPDTDRALQWAEDRLLATRNGAHGIRAELTLAEIWALHGSSPEMLEWFGRHLTRQVHPAGGVIIREGDADRSLYLLAAGTVNVVTGGSDDGPHRIGSFSPGTVFGEIAFLDAGLRSAFAVADEEVVCHVLTLDTFERLRRERPDFAVTFLANLSLDLAHRLRTASTEIRALQD
jgi:sulfate permease, SulP family